MKQRMAGFQKPAQPKNYRQVGMAVVSYSGANAVCSCGWSTHHMRAAVREDSIDRHLTKRHEGRGIRI